MASPRKGLNGIIDGILLFLLVCFLSIFIRTCFSIPSTSSPQEEESVPVAEPTVPVETVVPVEEKPSPKPEEIPEVQPSEAPAVEPVEAVPVIEIPVQVTEPEQPAVEKEPSGEVKDMLLPTEVVVPGPAKSEEPVPAETAEPAEQQKALEEAPVSVPEAPKGLKSTGVLPMVPDAPYLFTPTVMTQDEYEMFFAPEVSETSEEEDPFADFYVAGEGDDELLYENGIYYLSLFVNDEYMGDIETEFMDEDKLIKLSQLDDFIGSDLTQSAHDLIFAGGEEYLSLSKLEEKGVDYQFDGTQFTLYLTIPYDWWAIRNLSVSRRAASTRDTYGLSGAIPLKAAKFSWVASLNLYGAITYPDDFDEITSRSSSLYVDNRLAFLQTGLDFSFSFFTTRDDSFAHWDYALGTWTAFHEFPDQHLRLTFGSVGSNLSDRTTSEMGITTNIGVSLEKSYAYGPGSALSNQYTHDIQVMEASTIYIFLNSEDKEREEEGMELPGKDELEMNADSRKNLVFTRHLQPGIYRLRDFIFTQGYNRITIYLYPDSNPLQPEVIHLDTSFDSRLLAKGDSTWGLSLSMPKGLTDDEDDGGDIRYYDGIRRQWASYYPQYFTARVWQAAGVNDVFTINTDFSATPGAFSGTVGGVWANILGTTQMQASSRFSEGYEDPILSASVTERLNDQVMHGLGSLSLSFTYNGEAKAADDEHRDMNRSVMGSFSYSGTGIITKLRYSISGSLNYIWHNDNPTWTLSASTGASLFRGFSLSASASLSGSDATDPWDPTFSATISGSLSLGPKASLSSSTTFNDSGDAWSSIGMNVRPTKRDSVNLSLSGIKWNDHPENHVFYGTWTHTGNLSTLSVRQQYNRESGSLSTRANLTTSLAFADGLFGIARSVGDVYMMVRPVGQLKKSSVSIARNMDSSPTEVPKHFGNALYSGLSPYVQNSVVAYVGGGADDYGSGTTGIYQFTPRVRQAYVTKIDMPDVFTVSGMLYHADGSCYEQYSSPVYQVGSDENGNMTLEQDPDLYLFTDQVGRYILSSVKPGSYAFDLQVGENTWYLVKFDVPQMEDKKLRVLELTDLYDDGPFDEERADDYDETITLQTQTMESDETFWQMIFPSEQEVPAEETAASVAP